MTEPAQAAPPAPLLKLRDDLRFSYQSYGDRPCYLIEDPVSGHYFQIGLTEYAFIREFDGHTTQAEALARLNFNQAADDLLLDETQARQLSHWLTHSQLAYVQHPERKSWHLLPAAGKRLQLVMKFLNPIFMKISLGSPDRWLQRSLPWFGWMLMPRFFGLWLFLVGSGLYLLLAQPARFAAAASGLLTLHNALWLGLAWVLIKTVHEIAHGWVCKHYGGHVHEAGIFLILFAPLGGYVNASSMWRFTSKWQRIHVSIAGMYIELLIAGIAAWVWTYTETSPLNYLAYNLILIAGIGTLVFNANPLMRFDGYYILSDLLDIPNLYGSGQRYMRWLWRWLWQGRREAIPNWPAAQVRVIKVYGLASWLWRVLVMVGLLSAATLMFHQLGMVIALLGLLSWLGVPLFQFITQMRQDPEAKPVLRRLTFRVGVFLLLGLLVWQLPWSRTLSVPAVVDYAGANTVRVESPGFVSQIAVKPGDTVAAGALLLVLDNKDLQASLQDLNLQVQISQLKQQQSVKEGALSAYQVEQEKLRDLLNKQRETASRVAQLTLYAPIAGTVIAEDLQKLDGVYLQQGQEILTLGNVTQMEIRASIPQQEIEEFRAAEGGPVTVYADRQPLRSLSGELVRLTPGATSRILHPALTALGGGALPVRPRPPASTEEPRSEEEQYEYLTPRFIATVKLTAGADIGSLQAGETAAVLLHTPPRKIGYWLSQWFTRHLLILLDPTPPFA